MPRAGLTSGTTYSASFILPPHSVPVSLPCRQVPIGDNLLNRLETVNYDPFELYPGFIRNRNLAFIGDVGNGKSASMKTFLERMLLLPERVGIDPDTSRWVTRKRQPSSSTAKASTSASPSNSAVARWCSGTGNASIRSTTV